MNPIHDLVLTEHTLIRFLNAAVAASIACGIALFLTRWVRKALPLGHAILVAGLIGTVVGTAIFPPLRSPGLLIFSLQDKASPEPVKSEALPVTIATQPGISISPGLAGDSFETGRYPLPLRLEDELPSAAAPSLTNNISPMTISPAKSLTPGDLTRLAGTLFCAAWFMGSAVALTRAVVCVAKLRRWFATTKLADGPQLVAAVQYAAQRVGLSRRVNVYQSSVLPAPVTLGLFRPCIVVPAGIERALPADQLRAVLQHEMAHVVRFDLWIGLLQQVAHILHWWNPLIRITNRRISDLREQICDDIALREIEEPNTYAATLVRFAERCSGCVVVPATLGISSSPAGQLEKRIRHIVTRSDFRHTSLTRCSAFGVAAAALLMTGTILGAQIRVGNPPVRSLEEESGKNLRILSQNPEGKGQGLTGFEGLAGGQVSRLGSGAMTPMDPAKELASFQGTWSWDYSQPWTWPQPIGVGNDSDDRQSEKRWVIDGNQITWVGRDGRRVCVTFTIDPFKTPKQIDFAFVGGPHSGKKSIGIYETRDNDHRTLCMTDPGTDAPRPTEFSAGSLLKQSFMGIHRVPPPAKPTIANELKRLQGVWQMELCDSTLQTFGGTQQEASKWQWTIKDDEVLWSRQGEVWKLKLEIDPVRKTNRANLLTYVIGPFDLSLTFLSGPFQGAKCKGIYGMGGVDGQSLMIALQDPESNDPPPREFRMGGGVKTGLMILRPSKPSDAEREIAAFQGDWTLRNFDTGRFERNKDTSTWPIPAGKGPDKSGAGSELRWTIRKNEITWTSPSGQEIKGSFTIDPYQTPKQITLTFLSGPHQGETCSGIYQRDDLNEKILWLCMSNPGSNKGRPKEFSYQWGEGRSLLSLYPMAQDMEAPR